MSIRDAERPTAALPDRQRPARDITIGVVALLAVGTLLRIWVLASSIGAFDADSAVPGLMARHILHGELPVFYWGQPYGGSVEAFAAAAAFLVLPPWVIVVKLVPMVFCAAATVLIWRIGCHLVGDRAAALGAAFFWATPFTIWYSTKTGPYWAALTLALLCVLLVIRLGHAGRPRRSGHAGRPRRSRHAGRPRRSRHAGRPPLWEPALLGVALGLAWWANPSVLLLVPVAALVLVRPLARHWRVSWAVAAGFVLGGAPWILFNLRNNFLSLDIKAGQPPSTYLERLEGFFTTAVPMAVGLRRPFTHAWLFPPAGQLLYAAALVAFGVFTLRSVRDPKLRLLCAVVLAYPFLYSLSPFGWYLGQPRYVLFLLPFLALVAGRAAGGQPLRSGHAGQRLRSGHAVQPLRPAHAGRARAWVGLATSAAVAVAGIALFPSSVQPQAWGAPIPTDTSAVHDLLRQHHVTRAFAHYWIAYRLTFETRERTIVAPVNSWRYTPYQDAVARADRPGYIFLERTPVFSQFLAAAAARSVPVDVFREGPWAVVVPQVRVLPGDWPEVFGCPDQCRPSSWAWR